MMTKYKPTIGLEIHIQLKTKSKMFCGCDNDAENKAPNSVICPICLGMPGTLPVPNRQAIEWTVKLGKFLGGDIASLSRFDRKHYFYPDLPKGYQISQYDWPIVKGGAIAISGRKVKLTRVHLEEDAGKLIHPKGSDRSFVDLNRAGTPLMEVVTEPDMHTPAEAKALLQRLRLIVRYLGISDADMEKGHFRCDANVSVVPNTQHPTPNTQLGTPVEVKNLNSFLMVEKALAYEVKRQSEILSRGEKINKETRGWDDAKAVTVSQRSKEQAPDYRYFPEPDIPVLSDLDKLPIILPESIEEKIVRAKKVGIAEDDIDTVFSDDVLMDSFDRIINCTKDDEVANKALNLVINFKSVRLLDGTATTKIAEALCAGKIGPQTVRPLVDLILEKKISVQEALDEGGFEQISDDNVLRHTVLLTIKNNPQAMTDYRAGKKSVIGFLTGQVMKESRGQASPQIVAKILNEKLNKE